MLAIVRIDAQAELAPAKASARQRSNLVLAKSPRAQDATRLGRGHRGMGAAEPRSRSWLEHAVELDERAPRDVVGGQVRLVEAQDRGRAGVGVFHQRRPFGACAAAEDLGETERELR